MESIYDGIAVMANFTASAAADNHHHHQNGINNPKSLSPDLSLVGSFFKQALATVETRFEEALEEGRRNNVSGSSNNNNIPTENHVSITEYFSVGVETEGDRPETPLDGRKDLERILKSEIKRLNQHVRWLEEQAEGERRTMHQLSTQFNRELVKVLGEGERAKVECKMLEERIEQMEIAHERERQQLVLLMEELRQKRVLVEDSKIACLVVDQSIETEQESSASIPSKIPQSTIILEQRDNAEANDIYLLSNSALADSSNLQAQMMAHLLEQKNALARSLAELTANRSKLSDEHRVRKLEERLAVALEMLGERSERVTELEADIADMKEAYRRQTEELLGRLISM